MSPVQAARLPPDRLPAPLPGLLRSALPPSIRHFKDATLRQSSVDCCCGSYAPPDRRLLSDTAGGKWGTSKSRPRAIAPLFSDRPAALLCAALLCSPGSLADTAEPSAGSPLLSLPARSDSPWPAGWLLLFSENQEAACPTYAQPRIGSGRALGEETAGVGRAHRGRRGRANTGVRPWCNRRPAVSVARERGERERW